MVYRILLVDDETAIIDWLHHLINEVFREEVEVYKTDNPVAAMKLLDSNRFDIAVLDINMPVLSGISMLDEIAAKFPELKVIFLTGYQQFEYARKAVDKRVVAYVLKNEEDDVLIAAIKKAMEAIKEEIQQQGLLESARRKLDASTPILRREFMNRLIQGLVLTETVKEDDNLPVRLNVSAQREMCLLIGFIDEYGLDGSMADNLKLLFAAGLAVEEIMERHFIFESAMPDESCWIWLLQTRDKSSWDGRTYAELKAVLENAQTVYNRNTQGNLVFIYGSRPISLEELPAYYMKLRPLRGYVKGGLHAVLTDEDLSEEEFSAENGKMNAEYEPVFRKAPFLQHLLEQGEKEEFYRILDDILTKVEALSGRHHPLAVESFMTISAVLISYLNRTEMMARIALKLPVYKLFQMDLHPSWAEMAHYFRELASMIFELQSSKRENRAVQTIEKAKEYIRGHLNEDLSLILLAEKVYLNASYLSILFKNKTGMNISEFIKQERLKTAKALLAGRKYRVNEIGKMIGYNNAAYFTRFFKTETGLSPQEYRDNIILQP